MTKENNYRHEFKFLITDVQLNILQSRISSILQLDSHIGPNGCYNIRSLYFDDYSNRCFFENENGNDPREKMRIRIYNYSSDIIKLECKRKESGKTFKTSCRITKEETLKFINAEHIAITENTPPLLRKLLLQRELYGMKPVIIVDYQRVPYIYDLGNVRVTFDKFISSASNINDFFSETLSVRPILGAGAQLMEVKFDDFLPDYIHQSLQMECLDQTAFSKYYLCRKYSL